MVRRRDGFGRPSADSALTGRENVALFARLYDVPRGERAARIDDAIAVMGLTEAARRPAATYSGGMIRRLERAQALVSAPRLLILDEPTIGLDPVARAGVWQRILHFRATTGMTVLVTTHYVDEAEHTCGRVALMHRGRIQAVGTSRELVAGLQGTGAETLDDVSVPTQAMSGPIHRRSSQCPTDSPQRQPARLTHPWARR